MNNKYERYIDYIVNDIKPPYFKNMRDSYGLSEKEYNLVLSKVFNEPVRTKVNMVYNQLGDMIYLEDSDGYWYKQEYNDQGDIIYYENSDGYWWKKEYNDRGNKIYYENSYGTVLDYR